ncbi:MAG: VCBS repeat-containing protein [Candidatus Midichloria sp.]|nr:VCBS repeat-containing protein [Candidatus Midichloria sp.]
MVNIVSGNAQSKNISILLGNGDGIFQSDVSYGIGYGALGLVIADFNGDSRSDVATANHELTLYQYY